MKRFKRFWAGAKIAFWLTFKFSHLINWLSAKFLKRVAEVSRCVSLEEARDRVSSLTYSEDKFLFLGKGIKHSIMWSAEWVQWYLDNGLIPQTDCDEFARYAIANLQGIFNIFIPRLLTVRWQLPDGTIEGHNTCIFQYLDSKMSLNFGTLCNWGLVKDHKNVHRAAEYFARENKGSLIAYTVSDPRLKILKHVKI